MMRTYVALLRGINVSGRNVIKMHNLCDALQGAGLENIRSYIQSGNLVFGSQINDTMDLASIISERIKQQFNMEIPVMVLLQDELFSVKNENPFILLQIPSHQLYVSFLEASPEPDRLALLMKTDFNPDELIVSGKVIYLWCKSGYGKTRLTNDFFENKLKMRVTTRNWNTINKLCSM